MEGRWSDERILAGMPRGFSEMVSREDRKDRIKPFWDLLVNDKEPKENKESLMRLMHDLKEEGNALFKEGQYDIAWMHYRNALCVVKILENRFYHTVDKEFTSSLFSNRAFCCLKKSMFNEAVQDCDSATNVFPRNIKAYYRQAQAYKQLKKYKEAYNAASKGLQIEPSTALKELIEELSPLLKHANLKVEASVKEAHALEPVDAKIDSDWLAGTNIAVTEKHLSTKGKMTKKGKKKSRPSVNRVPSSVKVDGDQDEGESDESSTSVGAEDDMEFANLLTGVRKSSSMLNGMGTLDALKINPPQHEEDAPWSFPHDSDNDELIEDVRGQVAMGLDSFSTPELQPSGSENTSVTLSNPSSGTSSQASQSPSKALAVSRPSSSANASPAPVAIPQIIFPLQDDFDFRMVCNQCFTKVSEGVKGYRYMNATHQCNRDVLIVKKRDVPGISWVKIRQRPDVKGHYGGYKVCTQFNSSKPCKVSEEKCTFPHTQAELQLWTKDRNGQFSIPNFMALCKQYKIYDSAALAAIRSKQQYIPGLNYVMGGEKAGKSASAGELMLSPQTAPPPHGPVGSREPATSQGAPRGKLAQVQLSGSLTPAQTLNTQPLPHQQNRYPQENPYFSQMVPYGQPMPPYSYPAYGFPGQREPPSNALMYQQQQKPQQQQQQQQQQRQAARNQWKREAPGMLQEAECPKPDQLKMAKLESPLAPTHEHVAACQTCFKPTRYPGIYEYVNVAHKCEETMLAMKERTSNAHWVRVRERKNHREFPGQYILCNSVKFKNPNFCKYGEEVCSFAHNDVERTLWTLEKDGKFNITEFMIQIRKSTTGKGFSLKEVLKEYGGYFDFICRSCYYGQPPKISYIGPDKTRCSSTEGHKWHDFKILAHIGQNAVTVINPRGFLHKSAFFRICKYLKYCQRMVNANCKFAHSPVERACWMVERDCDIGRDKIVNQSKQLLFGQAASGTMNSGLTAQVVRTGTTTTAAVTDSRIPPAQTAEVTGTASSKPVDSLCPIEVVEICQTCWKNGQKTPQQTGRDRCVKGHANWSCNVVFLLRPSQKELRPLPKIIPKGLNFLICKYIKEGKRCTFTGSGPCQYAHCQEELDAWKFMCMHNLKSGAELSEYSKAAQKTRAESTKPKISGQSVVSATTAVVAKGPAMPMISMHTYYCHYCGVSCNSQKQWDEHCASEKHNFNVNSDKEHQWNYRQPPWTYGRNYELCDKHMDGDKCQYSNVLSMYNLCPYAHGQDELDEWRERYEWRKMKREMARQERVFSYMDELLETYESSTEPVKVICENLDGVNIQTQGDLHMYKKDKHATFTWAFTITTAKTLQRVALLHNRDRLHFAISNTAERSCQIAQGEIFCHDVNKQGLPIYTVELKFTGGMFGSFQQWIVFDFGSQPVLCRKISMEVGSQEAHEKVQSLRKQLTFDRWTSQNREVIRQDELDPLQSKLTAKYKEPSSSEMVVSSNIVSTELNQYNYKPKMHKLLELEEMTRHKIISSFNLCETIECVQTIEDGAFLYARPGELFARVPLKESLTEDTDAGKLILTSVRKVLLAPQADSQKVVFEAIIVREENFNYDGRGRDYIYLCLSAECVSQLKLKPGTRLDMEIQFVMDRLFFCRMHFAVDELRDTSSVFPDVPKINPLRNEKRNLKVSSSVLNQDQMAAVRHIVAERTGYTPPFVLYGPFGTGKTETIAQATMVLLKETRDTCILICAQSNSAADLYIVKHLNAYLKRTGGTSQLCRIYQPERRVYTVDKEVKKYCLVDTTGDSNFRLPKREDIEKCRVVICTVTTSLALHNLGLHGLFTHIFIDEAAQTLESESLMPLSLATEKTCIVLAGDHHQISPKVYSDEAKKQSFHESLLERLFNYYDAHSSMIHLDNPLNIFLSINYRTKMEILRFISAVCYGGPDVLKSEANIRSVLSITPLMFYAVQGREIQEENNVSYYNLSEVHEIVERVDDLYEKWPDEWGPRAAKEIGVVTPYYDQVTLIRKALRKRNAALKEVIVERVQGVQGKEFRAMFISTVRTQHLIESPHVQRQGLTGCDGNEGDFGFLSDLKLLNTALTRTQSAVVVVGDPVALCAIGECRKVWQTYLKHCQNMRSLFPQRHTFDSIRQQVQNLMSSPYQERLVQMANERQSIQRQAQDRAAVNGAYKEGSSTRRDQPSAWNSNNPAQSRPTKSSTVPAQNGGASSIQFGDVDLSRTLSEPRITPSSAGAGAPSAGGSQMYSAGPVAALSSGFQNVTLGPSTNGLMPRMPLTPLSPLRIGLNRPIGQIANSAQQIRTEAFYELGEDFVIDQDILSQVKGPDCTAAKIEMTPNYTHQQLVGFLEDSRRFVHCKLRVQREEYYGESIPDRVKIAIPSRILCGQGNDQDEVVIELVTQGNQPFGKVVGILKREVDLTKQWVICQRGDSNGMMKPVNEGIQPMYNVKLLNQNIIVKGSVYVYRITKSRQVRFSHAEKVLPMEEHSKLFACRFLRYDDASGLPLCIVLGVIPAEENIASSMQVLDLEHYIKKAYNPAVTDEVNRFFPGNFALPQDLMNDRHMDLRDRWCFTIDATADSISSRAFSIDQASEDSYQVGVHVTDVATLVQRNSNLDMEARKRGMAVYPVQGEPVGMLPDKLASQICNLRPLEDKLALSILLTVKSTGEVTQVHVQKTIINCKKSFSYAEAEENIHDVYAHQDYMKSCLLVLAQIASVWRKARLGNAATYHGMTNGEVTSLSQLMVEELIIATEMHVAQILMGTFPELTPLLVQSPPQGQAIEVWKKEHAADAVNSIALTKPFLKHATLEVCKCGLACTHTVNYVRQFNISKRENIDVISLLWDALNEAVGIDDFATMQNIIVAAENHPQMAVAMKKLSTLQEGSKLVCGAEANEQSNYAVNCKLYTSFANPICCYVDIVVQRLLLACVDQQPSPYTKREILALCAEGNISMKQKKSYEEKLFIIQLSSALLSKPLILNPVVVKPNLEHVQVCFPTLECMDNLDEISLKSLGIIEPPVQLPDGCISLTWQERVYDLGVLQQQRIVGSNDGELNPDRFIYRIPAFLWQRLLMAVREQDDEQRKQKLAQNASVVGKQVANPSLDGQFMDDITSEVQKLGTVAHIAKFSLKLHADQVLKVQLSARLTNGLLAPYIQLVNLTSTVDVCVQHREHPVQSFIPSVLSVTPVTSPCADIGKYQTQWAAVSDVEAVTRATGSTDRLIVNNVAVKWSGMSDNNSFLATMTLPFAFLKQRCIKLTSTLQMDFLFNPVNSVYCNAYFSDFLCLRYGNLTLPFRQPGIPDSLAQVVNNRFAVTWVGHCRIVGVNPGADNLTFHLELVQSDVPLPLQLVQRRPCTIEWIMRTEADRMVLYGLNSLEKSSKLAQNLALRLSTSNNGAYNDVDQLMILGRQLEALNEQQDEALQHALVQPLTVINGCVASGKSMLATKLATMYVQRNLGTQGPRMQVLLCAPSENAVDVINDNFLSLQHNCPNVVRVYGRDIERMLHPDPKDIERSQLPLEDIITEYSPLSLYNRVRSNGSQTAKRIIEFESLFSLYRDDIAEDQYEEYIHMKQHTEAAVLRDADVILCTCVTAAQPRITSNTNIQQIIIDDVNAIIEPQVMIPIAINSKVKQITLFGDKNQLGPQVMNQSAATLGLAQPIINDYVSVAVNLNVQYRVHSGIIDFPSSYGYGDRLLCGSMVQKQPSILNWPGGRNKPSVFCRLDGEEASLSLDVNNTRASCVFNSTQADFVTRVAVSLVTTHQVSPANIAVLCASRAQCLTLLESIAKTGQKITCLTYTQAQGVEYDYVVLCTVHSVMAVCIEQLPDETWLQQHLGDNRDPGLVMTALTRARKGLIIVGNDTLLRCVDIWKQLLSTYSESNRLVTADRFLSLMSM